MFTTIPIPVTQLGLSVAVAGAGIVDGYEGVVVTAVVDGGVVTVEGEEATVVTVREGEVIAGTVVEAILTEENN